MYRWIKSDIDLFGDFGNILKEWEKNMSNEWVHEVFAQHVSPNPYRFDKGNNRYVIEVVVPGWYAKDMTVSVNVGEQIELTISGEIGKKSFKKAYKLTREADIEKITCQLSNGILYVYIPRKKEAVRGRTIPITQA